MIPSMQYFQNDTIIETENKLVLAMGQEWGRDGGWGMSVGVTKGQQVGDLNGDVTVEYLFFKSSSMGLFRE